MKNELEIKSEIVQVEKVYAHVLTGSLATVTINAPRALMQIAAETQLATLYWTIGKTYKSKLKGIDH